MTQKEHTNTFIVSGSYGDLTVDKTTGVVLDYDTRGEEPLYANIEEFDVTEYIQHYGKLYDNVDIIHIQYWTKDGVYVEVLHHRSNPNKTRI